MNLKDLKAIFHKELDADYGSDEVSSFFFILTEHFFNITRLQQALDINLSITKEEQTPIFEALEQLKQHQPIQYIIGETEFYGLPFKVNKNTLIPRPETEELVAWILENELVKTKREQQTPIQILDIGTGTGCIAISIAKHLPNAKVYALDVSEEALKIAKQNAKLNQVDITFIHASILDAESVTSEFSKLHFDVIVSNPPYVRDLEKQEIKPNVLNNEPHLALFVSNENPLQFYKAITTFAQNTLKPNGLLFFEINEYLGKEMKALLEANHFNNIELKKDIFNKDRMLKGCLN